MLLYMECKLCIVDHAQRNVVRLNRASLHRQVYSQDIGPLLHTNGTAGHRIPVQYPVGVRPTLVLTCEMSGYKCELCHMKIPFNAQQKA